MVSIHKIEPKYNAGVGKTSGTPKPNNVILPTTSLASTSSSSSVAQAPFNVEAQCSPVDRKNYETAPERTCNNIVLHDKCIRAEMAPKIEGLCEDVQFGEGPHWDISRQCLYFVDILGKTINRYVPENNTSYKASFDTYPSFIIPVEGDEKKFVLGLGSKISVVTWDGLSDKVEKIEHLCEMGSIPSDYRLNDGKCDASGRLWTGSTVIQMAGITEKLGSIFSYEKGSLKNHGGDVSCSNGLTWSKDNKTFFFIDSFKKTVDRFDYDIATGNINNRTVLFSFDKNKDQFPDGMTIDEDGNLWVACFFGKKIIKIDSKKPETLLDTIELPAQQVTSAAWGGKNLDELYVTVGKASFDGKELDSTEQASIYRITGLGTKGFPMINFKLT
ncbi:hypothetical protein HHI36_005773 [Cryptolaemus montrouzieri]|uniref:Regucalcin n=1 Tax=Cryptolaemus montrouzieri TaxID=559131 RepID=A0ABD2NV64_9CUCU